VKLAQRFGIPRSTVHDVTDKSDHWTKVTDMRQIRESSHRTAGPATGQERDASTCEFDTSVTPGFNYLVDRGSTRGRSLTVTPPPNPDRSGSYLPVPPCECCGRPLNRRAGAKFCSAGCRQKAHRARLRARAAEAGRAVDGGRQVEGRLGR
jgi:hypothetical protein